MTKAQIREELSRLGVTDTPAAATKDELEQRLEAARSTAGAQSNDAAQMLVTRGAGFMRIEVTAGSTIQHGDPEAGEERRDYTGGDQLVVPAPDAVQFTLNGQAIMLGSPEDDDEGSSA